MVRAAMAGSTSTTEVTWYCPKCIRWADEHDPNNLPRDEFGHPWTCWPTDIFARCANCHDGIDGETQQLILRDTALMGAARLPEILLALERVISTDQHEPKIEVAEEVAEEQNIFRRKNGIWLIRYDGRSEFSIQHLQGLVVIQYLLQRAGQRVSAEDLRQHLDARHQPAIEETHADQDLEVVRRLGPVGTQREFEQELRLYNDAIEVARDTGNRGEVERIEQLRGDLINERQRDVKDPRHRISGLINRAIKNLKTHDETLARHLDRWIETPSGRNPCYDPRPVPDWVF